jgi:hypothetical protein
MTALTIVQEAAAWLGLPQPDALFGATDAQAIQLRTLLNEEGFELATWPDKAWTKLTKQKTFTTVAANEQTGALADDFSRFLDGSIWDRTQDRPVWGPMSPQQWQQEQAGPTFTTMYYGFRLRGNDWLMTPTPTAGDTIAYEYVSNLYVYASGDTLPTKSAFSDDTDTSIFPEVLVSRGVRWRFLRAKGMPYAQEYALWIELLQRTAARDGGMPTLSVSRNYPWTRLSPFVPDGNFPS